MFCFLECKVNAEVNPGLFPVTEIEFKVDTDILGKIVGSTENERTGEEPIISVYLGHIHVTSTIYFGFFMIQGNTTTKTDTGIYFPFGNYHIKTIGGSHFEVKHIPIPFMFVFHITDCRCRIVGMAIPHITDLTTDGESTFPNAGQGIIVGNINTYSV